ncbi:MAG: PAC2 family protein [Nitrososphaerota archaeon]|uniref:PAC2 family protein n=1 Tax=Candidatus Bathycorpusculum sp. TaxID=2994959 RepID=UPI002829946E|nr:PAC2 family protein [Candidatus Termiticorpusculum sp.]MCL2257227.1 PAC2 family protein [Candidatus Termiticorpusculum sp.]MCL2292625.1 PAC2 family protein [Candidatus Termiticorpusculum sp.]MDR0459973.1 PAC2 family protein [Nitrososphaerota archaeon]
MEPVLNSRAVLMDKPYLRMLSNPQLENPILVQGLPGFGNVGRIAAHFMVKFFKAKHFAELYSPTFSDYISITSKGIAYLPKYDFYHAQMDKNSLIIMSSEIQPPFDDVTSHYNACEEILNVAESLGCKFIVTLGGVPLTEDKTEIFVAATSNRLATDFMEKGGVIYSKGRIVGGTGLTLALAKERNLTGVCLLGTTLGFKADREAGFLVFKFLMKALGQEIKDGLNKKDTTSE